MSKFERVQRLPRFQPWFLLLKLCLYHAIIDTVDLPRLNLAVYWGYYVPVTVTEAESLSIISEIRRLEIRKLGDELNILQAKVRDYQNHKCSARRKYARLTSQRRRIEKITKGVLADISRWEDESVLSESSVYYSLE